MFECWILQVQGQWKVKFQKTRGPIATCAVPQQYTPAVVICLMGACASQKMLLWHSTANMETNGGSVRATR
jgi:hypothetical protein